MIPTKDRAQMEASAKWLREWFEKYEANTFIAEQEEVKSFVATGHITKPKTVTSV